MAFYGVSVFRRRPKAGLAALVLLFVSYVVATDLRPFEFGAAQSLSTDMFVPLIHHYRDIRVTQLWNIVETVLVYVPVGASLYAFTLYRKRDERLRIWPRAWLAVAVPVLLALGLETAQLWLPSRTPHIEDVLLALLGGFVGASCIRLARSFA